MEHYAAAKNNTEKLYLLIWNIPQDNLYFSEESNVSSSVCNMHLIM